MSLEQKLHDLGAECVCGDLLLNRVLVGRYRDGVFIPTPDAADVIAAAADVIAAADAAASGAVEEVVTPTIPKPRAARAAKPKQEKVPVVEEVRPPADELDPLNGLDDLLKDVQ